MAKIGEAKMKRSWQATINPWVLPLSLLAVAAVLPWAATVDRPALAALSAVNLSLCAIGIVQSFSNGLRPVALVFFVFCFGWLGVAPAYQAATGLAAWNDTDVMGREEVAQALLMNIAMTLSFMAGAAFARHRAKTRDIEPGTVEVRPGVLVALIGGGLLLAPYVIASNGGIGALFSSRVERNQNLREAGLNFASAGGAQYALVSILPAAIAAAAAVLTVLYIRRWMQGERRSLSQWHGRHLVAAVLAALLVLVFANPLTNTRFIGIAALGAVALTAFRPTSRRAGAVVAIVGLFGTLLIYPLANYFRQGVGVEAGNIRTGLAAFAGPDFDGFQQIVNAVVYVEQHGYSFGRYISSSIAFFIPRSVWEGKAQPASVDVAGNAGYWFVNLSLPPNAELYLEFGWVGLIVGLLLLGYLAGRSDWAWLNAPGSRAAALAPYFAMAMLGILRGPSGSLAPVYLTTLALIALGLRKAREPQLENIRSRKLTVGASSPRWSVAPRPR